MRIEASVVRSTAGAGRVAVAFSGGLDSSILVKCALRHSEVVACSAYASGSRDWRKVGRGATLLGVELRGVELTREEVEAELRLIDLPFGPTLMDRSLWCLYAAAGKAAKGWGAGVMLLGQLADELFGGYAKYSEAMKGGGEATAREMMEADVRGYPLRGRVRDVAACGRWVESRFPYEDRLVVELAEAMPLAFKIRGGVRKAILRRAAVMLGVPKELAEAPKKAAQYSSGVQRLVETSDF